MKTVVLKINPVRPNRKKIQFAAESIRKGGLVAFPTETVYGLGADAFNPYAVKKIFEVKNRPLNDPLIVHIANKKDLFKLVKSVPQKVQKLIDKFWPGPLTIVLKKSKLVPDIVTANLNTVAIRMPDNKIALSLIKESKTPIAAPSANLFGRPSATEAKHVLEDLKNKVDVVIDAGKTKIGLESTVVDFSSNTSTQPKVLRSGSITLEMLSEVLHLYPGEISQEASEQPRIYHSPGMFPGHYSLKAKLILAKDSKQVIQLVNKYKKSRLKVGILAFSESKNKYPGEKVKILGSKVNLKMCAKKLFSLLREFDSEKTDVIIAESIEKSGLGVAIMERLERASS